MVVVLVSRVVVRVLVFGAVGKMIGGGRDIKVS
jgi:hypothetical protein